MPYANVILPLGQYVISTTNACGVTWRTFHRRLESDFICPISCKQLGLMTIGDTFMMLVLDVELYVHFIVTSHIHAHRCQLTDEEPIYGSCGVIETLITHSGWNISSTKHVPTEICALFTKHWYIWAIIQNDPPNSLNVKSQKVFAYALSIRYALWHCAQFVARYIRYLYCSHLM